MGLILVLLGLFPVLGAFVAVVPLPVLGGADPAGPVPVAADGPAPGAVSDADEARVSERP